MSRHWNRQAHDLARARLRASGAPTVTSSSSSPSSSSPAPGVSIGSHPLFAPVTVPSHSPFLELDYNLHKSNSTYFSDLDVGRCALVTNLYTPGLFRLCRALDREVEEVTEGAGHATSSGGGSNGGSGGHTRTRSRKKYPGRPAVVLGSVYTNFKRETAAFEPYEMQSRVASWDDKWLYVVTYFVRSGSKDTSMGTAKGTGKGKKMIAVAISQYVAKKGRYTLAPARLFAAGGLLPPRPEAPDAGTATNIRPDGEGLDSNGDESKVVIALGEEPGSESLGDSSLAHKKENKEAAALAAAGGPEWTWERIEEERVRGLELVQPFIGLEVGLLEDAVGRLNHGMY